MRRISIPAAAPLLRFLFLAVITIVLGVTSLQAQVVSFNYSKLNGENLTNPTSLQFGPDGRLYVAQQNGAIVVYNVEKLAPNNYSVKSFEVINLVQQIPNHNDDGTLNLSVPGRQVTGILVVGTPTHPIIYVTSSDPRIGAGKFAEVTNLDTNSGIISRITWNGSGWEIQDLVRGLPRSEENHSLNGLALDPLTNMLYVAQGSNTNMGAPSNFFLNIPEYAYSTCILQVDLDAIGETPYNLPTLDDEDRTNTPNPSPGFEDVNDPYGGNDGKNQAMLVPGGPVQIYAPGFRNNFDVLITQKKKMFSFDNGSNADWGGPPINGTNQPNNNSPSNHHDVLFYVSGPGFYAGHPNPTRGNRLNTFNASNPQTPIPLGMENPVEQNWIAGPGPSGGPYGSVVKPGQITSTSASTNGICEYTASNFGGAMKGDIIAAAFNGPIIRYNLDTSGTMLEQGGKTTLGSGFGYVQNPQPLDVTAQGDNQVFPGTVWAAMYGTGDIVILEPVDAPTCLGSSTSDFEDSDGDGYTNYDETINATDYCSPSSQPKDFDRDLKSDKKDTDDDNDNIPDVNDKFPLDASNGMNTPVPFALEFDNSADGGIENWGFTGLMNNGIANYDTLFNPADMTVGGASLKFTVDVVSEGEAFQGLNSQKNAFQFGVNMSNTNWNYIVQTRVMSPFNGITNLTNFASAGMFIGTGDQDNYLRIACHAFNGAGGIQVMKEVNGVAIDTIRSAPILNKGYVDLFLNINTTTFKAQPSYSIDGGTQLPLGAPISIPPAWITQHALAVGIISSSNGPVTSFPATWDFIKVYYDQSSVTGQWHTINSAITPVVRHECSYVAAGNNFYLMGGRSVSANNHKPVQCYHAADSTWSTRSAPPVEIHHFQAVEYNGLIYAICAFTGDYPFETPLPNIYIYDPVGDTWTVGPLIPAARRRGSAGCVVYNNKIYVVCGIKNGHTDGWVNWLDVYDPIANTWTILPDAPRERDHFSVALVDDNIYCVGGRKTNLAGSQQFWTGVVPQVDIYDISSNTWNTLPSPGGDLPLPRAAASVAVVGNEILVIGGESPASTQAHDETHALNYLTGTWREVASLNQGRHGSQAVVNNGNVYVACGSKVRGNNGTSELGSQEVFYFFNQNAPTGTAIVKGNVVPSTTNKNFSLVLLADPKTSTLNLSNQNGNQVLVVDEITLSDTVNYKITNFPNLPISIAPNNFFTLNLKFQPLSLGVKNAFITVGHSGANGPVNVTLTGECVETIPCEEHPTEQNGLLVIEMENVLPRPAAWPTRTQIPGYTGSGFITYEGPEYFSNPGNNMFTIKVNINNPGKYRFQQRSWNDSTVANYNNDYFIKFPHTLVQGGGNTWKHNQQDVNKGVMAPDFQNGWIKVYQNRSRTWTFDTWVVEEVPHRLYVDFPTTGVYEIQVSGRDNFISLDRFIFYKESVTEQQATTNMPAASPITCIEVPWYADNDNDLYGNPNDHVMSIVKPQGYVLNNKDCNDANNLISPAGSEVQDGVDNNCNGVIDEGFGNPKALLVVGSSSLNPNDLAIKERIVELGYDVTVMTGSQATTAAGEAMNLIFISATVNSTEVLTKFTHVDVPVINCEPNLMDDLKMTNMSAATPYFGTENGTQLKIKGAAHPLKGTLTNGDYAVYTGSNKLVWGKPEAAAKIIASVVTDTTKAVIFGYDNNAQMYTLKAPARRVGFFLNETSAQALTPQGLELLDAALRWATNYNTIGDITIGDALFIVGNLTLSPSDLIFKTRLEGLGFDVSVIQGSGSQASAATGKDLIVISSSVSANDVGTKFTNLAIPLINWESGLMDDLKLTANSGGTSSYNHTQISITPAGAAHPLGAGLPAGQVAVYNTSGSFTQSTGYNTSTAVRVAGASGTNSNTTIFGYEKGVMMQQNTVAPERRVAFFAQDASGPLMNATGLSLFDAAIRWLTANLNTPPVFNISGNVTADEDFTGNKTVNVTALPVVLGEEGQVATYSLSPASVSFANISFSTVTGKVTITAKPDEFGIQEFTITANDGQANNNTYTQTFTLTINPVNDAPTFNVSGNITVLKNFATVPTVTVTPTPIPANEQIQNVTYSLSPSSVSFANISLNNATGQVSITSLPEQTGFQIFTLTANDGQNQFNTATKQFYLAVNNPTSNAICINCGGSPFVSVTGDTFKADNYFSGGTLTYTNASIPDVFNTFDDDLFRTERHAAAFSYNIPVPNGVYKVRLYFAETYFGATGGSATGGAGSRVFHVNLQGTQVLSYFDIFAQAGGAERAIMREFTNVAVSNGFLNISLGSVVNKAKISGICIIPDGTANNPPSFALSGNIAVTKDFTGTRSVTVTPDPVATGEQGQVVTYSLSPATVAFANIAFNTSTGKVDVTAVPGASGFQQFTLTANDGQAVNNTVSKVFYLAVNETRSKAMCWNCGGPQYVSVVGDTFKSDLYFESGAFTLTNNNIPDILNTFDDVIFRSERYAGSIRYNIPAANGLYKVKLLFSENHFGAGAAGGIGSRVFNVSIEENQVLTNYDIFAKAGGAGRAVTETFDSLNITDGKIDIDFMSTVNNAKISGICIIPYTTNEPPTFTVNTPVLTLQEDFVGTQTVTITPDPVGPADAGDVVTYTLSPAGTGIASVSINATTGAITINKINNKNGSQVFTVTANDGKPFGIASRSFTLNVNAVNDAPAFTLNQSIVLVKNFAPPVAVQVTPAAVPADEAGQVVTYSLSPPSASFANVSINQATGEVTFASINNAYGSQQFSIFADDGQSVNNVASQTFTLTVNQLGPNDPRPRFINCGGGPQYISLSGDTFKTDNFFTTPTYIFSNNSIPDILNTGDDAIYRTERYAGSFAYNIPVNNGTYNVSLHFAELYYGATGGKPLEGMPGKRVFNVSLEGTPVLTNFDLFVEAGGAERATTRTFNNIQITDGFVNLQFTAVTNSAKVNAISIIPVSSDCAGVQGGLATVNSCGICTGGTSGNLPNAGKDCAGVCSGTATLNSCNVCVGGTTGLDLNSGKDCAGVCNGTAFLNECNVCVGGTTGLGANHGKDCAGICGGTATLNSCNICTGGTTGVPANQGKDCADVCGGTAFLDDCGVCSGGTSGHVANSNKDACGVCFGNGSSCGPTCVPNEVVSFTIMRAGTAGEIGPLTNGMVLNKATLGNFSIRANTCNGQNVGSVKFVLNGSTFKTETTPPYALNGDTPAGNYTAWNAAVGSYTLTGIPYTGAGGGGTVGVSETVTFTVINQASQTPDCAGVVGGTATLNSCGICTGGTTGLPATQGKDCAGVCGGTATLNSCGICTGGTTGQSANAGKDCAGVCNGTAALDGCGICSGGTSGHVANSDKDACGVCFGDGTSCNPGTCVPVSITSLSLMKLCTAGPFGDITEGMVINLAQTPDFAVRANVCQESAVKSVKFIINGSTFRIENTSPYSINGEQPAGCFKKWYVGAIPYTLTVIAYSGLNGSGTASEPYTRHFTVVNNAAKMEEGATAEPEEALQLYPNPNTGTFAVQFYAAEQQDLTIKIFNHLGQVIYLEEKLDFAGELNETINLNAYPTGMYFMQMQYGTESIIKKVIIKD